jgi:hypothetical protein
MTQEKPLVRGKHVLLRGQLLLLTYKHLEITFAAENQLHNRDYLSLFSEDNYSLETVPNNLLDF